MAREKHFIVEPVRSIFGHNTALLEYSSTMSVMNASYASPTADAAFAKIVGVAPGGIVSRLLDGVNGWTIALTLFLMAVVYDQSMQHDTIGSRRGR